MPGLTYTLKADGTKMDKGLQNARQSVERFRKDVNKKPLLQFEGDLKAERNIVGMATELANARTGAEMLSVTLARTGDIFQNSLATGVVMAMGAALFDMAKQADEAFKNFQALSIETRKGMSKASVIGDIGDITQGLKTYDERLKAIRQEQQRQQSVAGAIGTRVNSWMGGPGVQEAMNETEKEKSRLQVERANIMARSNELSDHQMQLADAMARGAEEEVKTLQEKFRLENEIANIRLIGLDEEAKNKAIAAAEATSAAKQKAEEIALEKEQQAEAEKIAQEGIERMRDEQKEREQIAQKQADAGREIKEKGSKDLQAAEAKNKKAIEARLTLDEKLTLAKERLKIAQDQLAENEKGPGKEAAMAAVAAAQGEVHDAREAQIQRIMGGSTAAAAAQRAERKAVRDRRRAERILDAREKIKKQDAENRGAKPLKGDAAMNIAAPEKKDERPVTLLDKIEKEMVKLNNKLTVA